MSHNLSFSLEIFPPRTAKALIALRKLIVSTMPFSPEFISVTYGAGGSAAQASFDAIKSCTDLSDTQIIAHMTMVGQEARDVEDAQRRAHALGADGFVLLRGDAKDGAVETAYDSMPEFIKATRAHFECCPRYVAAYPIAHPRAASAHADLNHLKAKLDAGATGAISQFCFEPEEFLRFRDRAAAAGITAPIRAGILPFKGLGPTEKISRLAGLDLPEWLIAGLSRAEDLDEQRLFALATASDMIDVLAREGVEDFHIYTLNDAELTASLLGLHAKARLHLREAAA